VTKTKKEDSSGNRKQNDSLPSEFPMKRSNLQNKKEVRRKDIGVDDLRKRNIYILRGIEYVKDEKVSKRTERKREKNN
jgi:hypothetical protein